jgi:hypothetical protein
LQVIYIWEPLPFARDGYLLAELVALSFPRPRQGRNSCAIKAGGGADYRWNPRISFGLEGDFVHTGFFKQSQNDFQLSGGLVFHF